MWLINISSLCSLCVCVCLLSPGVLLARRPQGGAEDQPDAVQGAGEDIQCCVCSPGQAARQEDTVSVVPAAILNGDVYIYGLCMLQQWSCYGHSMLL